MTVEWAITASIIICKQLLQLIIAAVLPAWSLARSRMLLRRWINFDLMGEQQQAGSTQVTHASTCASRAK